MTEEKTVAQNKHKTYTSILSRLPLYIIGVFILGSGIVLCVKCEMGVSPVNSVPYVITQFVPWSLGTVSILFYLFNIILQLFLREKKHYVRVFLQLPVTLLFGVVIDLWDAWIPSANSIGMQIVFLCGSLFFTALGIMLIVSMYLVLDPPTGAYQAISQVTKKNLGTTKIFYDCSCVTVSLTISLLGAHRLIGFGIATIASAVCVGRILSLLQSSVGKYLERYFPDPATEFADTTNHSI